MLRQGPGLAGRERADGQLASVQSRRAGGGERGAEERVGGRFLAAVTGDQQQDRGFGGAKDFGQDRKAVGVTPLQVVDYQNQLPPVPQAGQQLAQRHKRSPPQLLRVGHRRRPAGGGYHRLDPAQNGEYPDQGADVPRQ